MWFRLDNGGAKNLENGHTFAARERADERSQVTWEIYSTIPVPGVGATVLMDGYATQEAAQEALDGFLAAHGVDVVAIDDPNADAPAEGTEGSADDEDETEIPVLSPPAEGATEKESDEVTDAPALPAGRSGRGRTR